MRITLERITAQRLPKKNKVRRITNIEKNVFPIKAKAAVAAITVTWLCKLRFEIPINSKIRAVRPPGSRAEIPRVAIEPIKPIRITPIRSSNDEKICKTADKSKSNFSLFEYKLLMMNLFEE